MIKLQNKDIPKIKEKLLKKQKGICPICNRNLYKLESKQRCLDHNHNTGFVRAVLCRGCNSFEGKVYKIYVRLGLRNQKVDYKEVLEGLKKYIDYPETTYIHPLHKNETKKHTKLSRKIRKVSK